MSQVYELVNFGPAPVTSAEMKAWMKVTTASEDVLITALISAATEWGEKYTGREFRANQWKLLLDSFSDFGNTSERFIHEHLGTNAGFKRVSSTFVSDRIELKRDPVNFSVPVVITHLVDATPVVVPAADYYLKKYAQSSEILLFDDKDWPTNTDNREQAIEITFTTKAYRCIEEIKCAIMLHVTNLYTNRGDCPDSAKAAEESGATMKYDQFRISRV